ncbi:DUF456 domain-containing protein [Nocardioides massiliensis]|uniref:Uncharacterized protein YqgC (DUF456 family) n=1 Tax=Nocardioides massiliensis TaxID=1325935 RepID=A0ABT9NSN0_9ACTN|nr:DUF456 domain-containing protein [Nocardioides massiliensis]MDP9823434.1 uncharacterized protein YqgC (DUF456 family) [Nocardioides massiliensis]
MTLTDVLVALAIAVGLVGIVVPVLPGTLLIAAAVVVWAFVVGGSTAWTVTGIALGLLAVGTITMYAVPGRRLRVHGVPGRTLVVGGIAGVVGFFVIPVIGLLVGFVLGVYAAESARLGPGQAWPSTKQALLAAGLSMLIELIAAMLATVTWVVGVVLT